MVRAALAMLLGTALPATAETTFSSRLDDLELRAEVGTGIYGDELTGNFGIQSQGIFDRDRRWLVSWSGDAELVIGGVAYEHPFYVIYGVQGAASGEGGYRLLPERRISPYISAGVDGALSAVTEPGVAFNEGATINNLDGLGGIIGTGDARLGVGSSYLEGRHSLVVELQPLVEVDAAESNLPLLGYFGGALRARYDWADRLVAIGEVAYAATPIQGDAALGTTSVTGKWTVAANAVVKFKRRFFGGIGLSVNRSATQLSYSTGQTYTTAAPVDSRLWLLFGIWP